MNPPANLGLFLLGLILVVGGLVFAIVSAPDLVKVILGVVVAAAGFFLLTGR